MCRDRTAQADLEQGLFQIDGAHHLQHALFQRPVIGDAGGRVVEPLRIHIQRAVAGPHRLAHLAIEGSPVFSLADDFPHRTVLETVQHVFAHGDREQVGHRTHISGSSAGHGLGRTRQIDAAHFHATAAGQQQAGHQHGQLTRAGATGTDDGHMRIEASLERHAVKQLAAGLIEQRQIVHPDRALMRQMGRVDEFELTPASGHRPRTARSPVCT